MISLLLLAAVLSAGCVVAAMLALLVGVALAFVPTTRMVAPAFVFPVPLAAMGAVLGSWGLANGLNAALGADAGAWPFWAWPIGFVVGGLLGLGLGAVLAARLSLGRPRAVPHRCPPK